MTKSELKLYSCYQIILEVLFDKFDEFCVVNCNKCIYGDNSKYCEQQWIIDN